MKFSKMYKTTTDLCHRFSQIMGGKKYIYNDLTFKLIGLSYKVFNNIGYGFQEKYYQRAYEEELKREKYKFKKE